eukprot:756424-Pelagomonas_calceolata.AAC.4
MHLNIMQEQKAILVVIACRDGMQELIAKKITSCARLTAPGEAAGVPVSWVVQQFDGKGGVLLCCYWGWPRGKDEMMRYTAMWPGKTS